MSDTTQGDTAVVRERVAEHELLDASGATVESEELATGIRYKLKGYATPFEFQSGLPAGQRNTMLACFGAKTLATNESSQVRNNPKGSGTVEEQMEAVVARFGDLDSGKWVDRSREGVGAKVDKDALALAINEVVSATMAARPEADRRPVPTVEAIRAKLESDKGYQATARNVPGVNEAYARLVGRPTKSVDDLL